MLNVEKLKKNHIYKMALLSPEISKNLVYKMLHVLLRKPGGRQHLGIHKNPSILIIPTNNQAHF